MFGAGVFCAMSVPQAAFLCSFSKKSSTISEKIAGENIVFMLKKNLTTISWYRMILGASENLI